MTGYKVDGHKSFCSCEPCRQARNAYQRERYAAKGGLKKMRHNHLQRTYGITSAQYAELHASQHGLCAICQQPEDKQHLAVDHDHTTGRVRGLLCNNCNVGIGKLRDDPQLLVAAWYYLTGD